MTLLFTLLTLAVLGVIAAVATGRIAGGLEEPSTSLPARALPEGEVTAGGLEAVRFSPALRGYRMDEVDAVLDRLGTELARRDQEIAELRAELRVVERSGRGHHPHRAYSDQDLGAAGYAPGYAGADAGQGYGTAGHPGSDLPGTEYPGQGYPGRGYAGQGYPEPGRPGQEYGGQEFGGQGFDGPEYAGRDHRGYPGQDHGGQGYRGQGYGGQGQPEQAYVYERPEYRSGQGRESDPRPADRHDR